MSFTFVWLSVRGPKSENVVAKRESIFFASHSLTKLQITVYVLEQNINYINRTSFKVGGSKKNRLH